MTMDLPIDDIELVSMAAVEDEEQKRAHHNALERKRRDHIKDSFYCLRDAVPQLRGEKASRALILNKATDYIKCLKSKNMCHKKEIDDIKKQNDVLEQEIDKIIKLNNSLGKERIELVGEDFVKVSSLQSAPPTFSRITEKDIGPYIGKTELETLDDLTSAEDEAAPITLPTAIQEITPGTNEENTAAKDKECTVSTEIESDAETDNEDKVVTDNENTAVADKDEPSLKGSIEECSTLSLWKNDVDEKTANKVTQVNISTQSKISSYKSGVMQGGTIQIPASALAKALPNGFKNVTAIYKQTGNNKPIRLQIITHNGRSEKSSLIAVKDGLTKTKGDTERNEIVKDGVKTEEGINDHGSDAMPRSNGIKTKITEEKPVKVADEKYQSDNKDVITSKSIKASDKVDTCGSGKSAYTGKTSDEPRPSTQRISDKMRTPQNQPLYARHRPLHSSPSRDKTKGESEFDSFNSDNKQPGDEFSIIKNHGGRNDEDHKKTVQSLPRDPSAIATISESELAFLTRPANPGNKGGESVSDNKSKERNPGKIEHGNIPILYKGSLLSDRDKEEDAKGESPHKQILYGARAMDGSRPFACHICGKSFNMLSSLKVHEHIHVPVKKKPYPCDLCHRSFMTLRILSQHKESHYGRISSFHRQASLGKKTRVSFATHPQDKNGYTDHGSGTKSPRTSITNMFHVRASSPGDALPEKSYTSLPSAAAKSTSKTTTTSTKNTTQRVLPTTHVRQGQVIVQARAGAGATAYKVRTKAECEEARNFGLKITPLKRSPSELDYKTLKEDTEHLSLK